MIVVNCADRNNVDALCRSQQAPSPGLTPQERKDSGLKHYGVIHSVLVDLEVALMIACRYQDQRAVLPREVVQHSRPRPHTPVEHTARIGNRMAYNANLSSDRPSPASS